MGARNSSHSTKVPKSTPSLEGSRGSLNPQHSHCEEVKENTMLGKDPSISNPPNTVHLCVYIYIYIHAWSIMKSYLKPRFQLHFPTTRTKFSLQIAALQWNQRAILLEAAWQQNEPVNSSRYSSARHGRVLEMEQIIYKKKSNSEQFLVKSQRTI